MVTKGRGGRLDDVKLSYTLGGKVGEMVRLEVLVGMSCVGRGQGDADPMVESDGGRREEAMGNPLGMKILHSLFVHGKGMKPSSLV